MWNSIDFWSSVFSVLVYFLLTIISLITVYFLEKYLQYKLEQKGRSKNKIIFKNKLVRYAVNLIIGASIFVILAVIYLSFFKQQAVCPKYSREFKPIFQSVKTKVQTVRDRFQAIDYEHLYNKQYTPAETRYIDDILALSREIQDSLLFLDDRALSWAWRATKYDYLAYTLAVLAEVKSDTLQKIEQINKANEYLDKALKIYYLAEMAALFGENHCYDFQKLYNWFRKNQNKNRLLFLKAWIHAFRDRMQLTRADCRVAVYFWQQIDQDYKIRWTARDNPSLRTCPELFR